MFLGCFKGCFKFSRRVSEAFFELQGQGRARASGLAICFAFRLFFVCFGG